MQNSTFETGVKMPPVKIRDRQLSDKLFSFSFVTTVCTIIVETSTYVLFTDVNHIWT